MLEEDVGNRSPSKGDNDMQQKVETKRKVGMITYVGVSFVEIQVFGNPEAYQSHTVLTWGVGVFTDPKNQETSILVGGQDVRNN